MGPDWFSAFLLKDDLIGKNLRLQLVKMLNEDNIPSYLKNSRLVLLSKTNKSSVDMSDIRPIAVLSQLTKILLKAIRNKIEESGSKFLESGSYQTGFKRS